MKFRSLFASAAAASLACGVAHADITYVVDHSYGSGSVMGTITTDGATGPLADSDFVSWDLTISDGTNSAILNTGDSVEANSVDNNIYATTTDLLFNFGPPSTTFYFYDNTSTSSICWSSSGASGCNISVPSADSTPGASIVIGNNADGDQIIAPLSGEAYVIGVASVPEPAAWALMLVGFGGLGAALRSKRRFLAA